MSDSQSKPISLPTQVTRVGESTDLRVSVGPIWTYVTLGEAVALRAQLDEQIASASEGFA